MHEPAPLRVRPSEPLTGWVARTFRSADRVWSNLLRELPATGVELVDHGEPDVWLCDGSRGDLPDTDKPIVAVLHEAPNEDERISPVWLDLIDERGREAAAKATRIVTCSQFSRRGISARYDVDLDRIDVAPYGVDLEVFRPDGPTADAWLGGAGGDGRPYVLFVGTVIPRKNVPLLREAMVELPSHQLALVLSRGPDDKNTENLEAATAPLAGFAVARPDDLDDAQLAALMRGADVLCLPSLSEGFGLPVVEAMACGTPVVVSDRGSLPEVAGDAGLVVEPEAGPLVDALRTAIAHRRELRPLVLERAAHFTWARTATLVTESLRTAAGHPLP